MSAVFILLRVAVLRASSTFVYICGPSLLNCLLTGQLREGSLYKTWYLYWMGGKELPNTSLPHGPCYIFSLSSRPFWKFCEKEWRQFNTRLLLS